MGAGGTEASRDESGRNEAGRDEAGRDEAGRGIDVARATAWFAQHLPEATPPLSFDLVAAGGSNLTYKVEDARGERWALRRPPPGRVLATAHDVEREYRIISALGDSVVPVPLPEGHCADPAVLGVPFYVMTWVDGLCLRDAAAAAALDAATAARATDSLVDVQVALHRLDPDAVGLGDLGRRDGYVARQLRRWYAQYEAAKVRELPLLEALHGRLAAAVPASSRRASIVHGDYRFDNTLLKPDGTVAAVLDWELCTLGDPVADFCWSLQYWADPGDEVTFLTSPPTTLPVFPRRDEVAAMYAERSGYDLSGMRYHFAFGWWKMACIVEGVYARRRAGVPAGAPAGDVEAIAARVDLFLEVAAEEAREGGI